ncbi:MAG TPA: zf-HC2 domain-containing protein [Gemmatimonadales bacterium]|nr:zf-HC2 domain-containing protein [Gemmatimonadales bacterium]
MTGVDRLSCEEAFRRLDDYLDRELSADEMRLVREHLEVCVVCATEFGFERGVIERVRDKLSRIDVSPDLKRRIALALDKAARGEA